MVKRGQSLAKEVEKLDAILEGLTRQHTRRLLEQFGVGPQAAPVLLSTAFEPVPEKGQRSQYEAQQISTDMWRATTACCATAITATTHR